MSFSSVSGTCSTGAGFNYPIKPLYFTDSTPITLQPQFLYIINADFGGIKDVFLPRAKIGEWMKINYWFASVGSYLRINGIVNNDANWKIRADPNFSPFDFIQAYNYTLDLVYVSFNQKPITGTNSIGEGWFANFNI